jgi:hypothetical protein
LILQAFFQRVMNYLLNEVRSTCLAWPTSASLES